MIGFVFLFVEVEEGEIEAVGHGAVGGYPATQLAIESVVLRDVARSTTAANVLRNFGLAK